MSATRSGQAAISRRPAASASASAPVSAYSSRSERSPKSASV
jgi:hypothetical protein